MRVLHKIHIIGASVGVSALLILATPAAVFASTPAETFSAVDQGVAYLANQQQADGSIAGFGGESDWAAIAIAAAGVEPSDVVHADGQSLVDYLETDVPGESATITGIERKILALLASGGDADSFGGFDYTSLLRDAHQDGQIGDPTLLNDDIFGIIGIAAIGDETLLPIAQDALDYLLLHQADNGGFSYTTDTCDWCGVDSNDTAAAIVAMTAAIELGLVHDDLDTAFDDAVSYLLATQQSDGGFAYDLFAGVSDGSSTAWSLIALNTIGSTVSGEAAAAHAWLYENQNEDGGFSYGAYGITYSDTYTTAHALIALLGTNWRLLPAPIERPAVEPDVTTDPTTQTPPTHTDTTIQPEVKQIVTTIDPLPAQTIVSTPEINDQNSTEDPVLESNEDVLAEETDSTTEPQPEMEAESSSLGRNVGFVLIGLALIGLAAYALRSRRPSAN